MVNILSLDFFVSHSKDKNATIGIFVYVTVLREPLTFMHRRTLCTGSQGPPGLDYGPPKAVVWPLWAGKAIAVG